MKYRITSLWDPSELGEGSHVVDYIGKFKSGVMSRLENSMHYPMGTERYKMIWFSLRQNFPGNSMPRMLDRTVGVEI